jgi:SAM-dependent methyltransferase
LTTRRLDLACASLPDADADGAWCRWILAFLKYPRNLLSQIARALRPGGALVVHEYFDYRTWRSMPRCPEVEDFVQVVMETWRADGGEPEVGLNLPVWLTELGFELKCVRPLIDIVTPTNVGWQWLESFFRSGLARLVDTGKLPRERAQKMAQAFAECESAANALMVTPGVIEIIAIKR